jgi:hypothetical protein
LLGWKSKTTCQVIDSGSRQRQLSAKKIEAMRKLLPHLTLAELLWLSNVCICLSASMNVRCHMQWKIACEISVFQAHFPKNFVGPVDKVARVVRVFGAKLCRFVD